MAHDRMVASAEFGPGGREILVATGGSVLTAAGINTWAYGRDAPQFVGVREMESGAVQATAALPPPAEAVAAQFTTAGPMALVSDRSDPTAFSTTARIVSLQSSARVGDELLHESEITCAHFSRDGARVAVGCRDGRISIWNPRSRESELRPFAGGGRLNSVRFSPDASKLVAAGEDSVASLWDFSRGDPVCVPLPHAAPVWVARFDAAGARVVTGSLDHTAKVWTLSGECVATLQHRAPLEYAEFSPDGLHLATAAGNQAHLWSVASGRQVTEPLRHGELVVAVRFSPDGRRVLTASHDGTSQLWDAETGLKLAEPFRHRIEVVSVAFSNDGRMAVSASLDGTATIHDVPVMDRAPPWLADLAEAVGGQRIDAGGIPESVPWSDYAALRARIHALPAAEPYADVARKCFSD